MAFGVTTILRSLGVTVTDEHIKQLEAIIPQVPKKAQEIIEFNLAKWQEMDTHLGRIEDEMQELHDQVFRLETGQCKILSKMEEILNALRTDVRSGDSATSAVGTSASGSDSGTGNRRSESRGRANGNAGGKH